MTAERVLQKSLNVRQTEELVASLQNKTGDKKKDSAPAQPHHAHLDTLRDKLQERFGTKVTLRYQKGKGAVEIKFFNDADLERILQVAGVPPEAL